MKPLNLYVKRIILLISEQTYSAVYCIILVSLFFLSSPETMGQNVYEFNIVDSQTHQPIDSVYVVLPHLERKYMSDNFGRLTIQGPLTEGDSVIFRHRNYQTHGIALSAGGSQFVKLRRLPIKLRDVEVVAYTQQSTHFSSPQTIATLHASDFSRNSSASIQPTLNTIPGVLMESRGAGGSRRLSIRGSLMRSPYGVRNVRVYWNEFPLTIADGSTGLELIDAEEIGQVDVLKGPQGSIYGEGHGGALLFRSKFPEYGELNASANLQLGSYGLQKQSFEFATSSKKTAVKVNYFRFRNNGYREQESVQKDQFNLLARFRPSSRREVKLFFMYYSGEWQLPGALDSLTAVTSPRAAVPFAIENNTRVERKWIRAGISNKIHFGSRFYNFTAASFHSNNKLNPYGSNAFYNGFKDEGANGFALRTLFGYELDSPDAGIHLMLGAEYQRDLNALAEFDLLDAENDSLRTSDETRSQYVNVFFKAKTHLNRKLLVDASLGMLTTLFDREDVVLGKPDQRDLRRHFKPIFLPQLSTRYTLNRRYAIYATVSRGVSMPTLWEIQASPEVEPERSNHFELGVRASLFGDALLVTLNGYLTQIDNAILEQPDSLGFSTFDNSGSILMRGLESTISLLQEHRPEQWISNFGLDFNLGIQVYSFENLVIGGNDFSGNAVPGVPVLTLGATMDIGLLDRFSTRLSYRHFDPVSLNYAETDFSKPYSLLDVRVSYQVAIINRLIFNVYLGVENLLDEKHSSFYRLNANNGKYYNPQAGQTIYGGLKITFQKPINHIK